MSDSNITKLALSKALKTLMHHKSFSKICVSDIVKECGLTRQSFYYHFKDKYDLMNWIYYTETTRFISGHYTAENWTDGFEQLCLYMQKNKAFYIKALNTTGQDSFPDYLMKYIKNISISVVENISGSPFDHAKWGFTIDFFSLGFVGIIVKWANRGMKENPSEYIGQIRTIFDGSLLYELTSK